MSDIADRADKVIALALQHSLAATRQQQIVAPDGHCCFCDEPVVFPGRFCDVDCRDDYDGEQAALVRAGKCF
ncbi:hypothetical protein RGU75_13720 [Glaciimonas sp. CA11.2]|uniref:hypothetical protein n=1 Tax=Glaciimonas sp. CA11.2 TaxID=3048601 RepID=UPI002AB3A4FD|nr:hypothetical protein [Glaciimonas sp. CA11.2]MDY7547286.1 hypothetical protein [Glaciimonas sp. CA11.2]